MGVRNKFLLLLLSLNLPLILLGQFVIRRGEQAVRENLGATFQRMAAESMDKVDRALFDIHRNVRTWSRLEVMQEVLTGDFDGRISTFLIDVSREYGNLNGLDVMDDRGVVVASSGPLRVGSTDSRKLGMDSLLEGRSSVSDIRRVEPDDVWVVELCEPIRAQYEAALVVGGLCVRWDAAELDRLSRVFPTDPSGSAEVATVLIRRDGDVISSPPNFAIRRNEDNLLDWGWAAAREEDDDGTSGFNVEEIPQRGAYLVGHSRSSGYEELESLGWSAVVLQDLDSAYATVRQIRGIVLAVWGPVALAVIGLSLALSHRLTRPLVQMARVAKQVADGDFEERVNHQSSDEIGTLAGVFNRMVEQLESQRALLIEDIANQRAIEVELRLAKDNAEQSTARFKAVLHTMGEGLVTVDGNGVLMMVNEEVEAIWDYRADELVGLNVEMLLASSARGIHRGAFKEFLGGDASRKIRVETRGLRRTGESFPLEISAAVTRQGGRAFVTAAVRDITDRRQAEEQISSALSEKEALLREVHHRVKNNLQVIISLLHLQSDHGVGEAGRRVLLDSENRVKSMALMHERLYRSKTLAHIDVKDYIEELCVDLGRSYSVAARGIELQLEAEDVALGMDTAIHCGLLVSELVSNAVKHAFPNGSHGRIYVGLRGLGRRRFELCVADNGRGMPAEFDKSKDSLGLQLVTTLAEHLDGAVRTEVPSGGGARFVVGFKDIDQQN